MTSAGTQSFPGEHTAQRITTMLLKTRQRFGLLPRIPEGDGCELDYVREHELIHHYGKEHKFDVLSLTTDRGSNIAKGAEDNNLFDWYPCICHILNTAVKDALEEDASIRSAVEACKKLSNVIRKSVIAWEELKKCQRRHIRTLREQAGLEVADTSHSDTDSGDEQELEVASA